MTLADAVRSLAAQGRSNQEIADALNTSADYVRAARRRGLNLKGKGGRPRKVRPRQPNLRQLAEKLYQMRLEGCL